MRLMIIGDRCLNTRSWAHHYDWSSLTHHAQVDVRVPLQLRPIAPHARERQAREVLSPSKASTPAGSKGKPAKSALDSPPGMCCMRPRVGPDVAQTCAHMFAHACLYACMKVLYLPATVAMPSLGGCNAKARVGVTASKQ